MYAMYIYTWKRGSYLGRQWDGWTLSGLWTLNSGLWTLDGHEKCGEGSAEVGRDGTG